MMNWSLKNLFQTGEKLNNKPSTIVAAQKKIEQFIFGLSKCKGT